MSVGRLPLKMAQESVKLEQDALLELFELDLTSFGGDIIRLHSGKSEVRGRVVFNGYTYDPHPIEGSGFDKNGSGTSSRPTVTVANINGIVTGLIADFDDMVGAVVTRVQVYARFLDAVNFTDGNDMADPSQAIREVYLVNRIPSLRAKFATIELSLPSELDGAVIPARVITTDVCSWQYRSADCGYTGGACADANDVATSDISKDKCGHRLTSCKLRFGHADALPFGGFPTAVRISR